MPRLYLKFYFAMLASLLVFLFTAGILLHVVGVPYECHRDDVIHTLYFVAIILSLVAFPVSRGLTSRVERLHRAVESLGAGDLSARVAVEGNDEVARLAKSFNGAAKRIEELVGAHKRLLANASHELRTPLARVRIAVELMKQSADPVRKAGLDQDIAELDLLIGEILLASRLDATKPTHDLEDVDLLALAAEECSRYHDVQLDGVPTTVRGDAALLRRLLRNLIENALRHGVAPVAVHLTHRDAIVELVVSDNGPAIPDDHAQHLFEPFYRPPGSKSGGAGLGLALVRQIVERHRGTVRYAPTDLGKSSFRVELPV